MQIGAVDEASSDPSLILPKADILILAAPVRSILALVSELPNLHPGPAVVLDVGSTKIQIVEAMERLPDRFDPLGGHPMCGKEALSLANAEASLFEGYPFAIRNPSSAIPGSAIASAACGVSRGRTRLHAGSDSVRSPE